MLGGLTTHRLSMRATLLKPGDAGPTDPDEYGEWVENQDPLTGEIVKVWVPYPDNPGTPDNEQIKFGEIKCLARGIVDGGIRVAGTTERFGDTYENMEFVKMWTSPKTVVTKADRITNIRSRNGKVMFWVDEEFGGIPRATVFNVNGVTPLFDAFNKHTENFILLERAEI